MCDYSLLNFPNRLAREGEDLVVHRFPSGSLGLASPADVAKNLNAARGRTFWERLKDIVAGARQCPVPAICVPPAARLTVYDIAAPIQAEFAISAEEEVTFEQLSANVNAYRDAIVFRGGRRVRLQELPVGLRMRVADLGGEEHSHDDLAAREARLAGLLQD